MRTWQTIVLLVACVLPAQSFAEATPNVTIPVDMSAWFRRDREECESGTRLTLSPNGMDIRSDHSYALFWQIPMSDGSPMALDSNRYSWLKKCDRPPINFSGVIEKQGEDTLIEVADYPWFTWQWKVDVATVEEQRVDENGKIKSRYDDFPAKIGISILKENSSSIREVAYVWSRHLPDEMMYTSETTVIPLVWKLKWRRFVVESGTESIGKWVSESRNVLDDYRRAYPGEEPGRIVRIYVSTDSDNTNSKAEASYANFQFRRTPPNE